MISCFVIICYLFSYLLVQTNINPKTVSLVLNFHNFNPKHFIFALSCCKFIFTLVLVILHCVCFYIQGASDGSVINIFLMLNTHILSIHFYFVFMFCTWFRFLSSRFFIISMNFLNVIVFFILSLSLPYWLSDLHIQLWLYSVLVWGRMLGMFFTLYYICEF